MKKFLTLLAFAGLIGAVNAQSTATTPEKEKAQQVEKAPGCAGHGAADAKKAACCAGKDAKASAAMAEGTGEGKAAGCCAGKASAAKGCHGDGAKADAGHGHDHAHGEMKEHACTEACKDGTHSYVCGEKGHACSEACHAKM